MHSASSLWLSLPYFQTFRSHLQLFRHYGRRLGETKIEAINLCKCMNKAPIKCDFKQIGKINILPSRILLLNVILCKRIVLMVFALD